MNDVEKTEQQLSPQEELFNFWEKNFIKLIESATDVPQKKEIVAGWKDALEWPGVRSTMIQAFSNILWEFSKKLDAARGAGMIELRNALVAQANANGSKVSITGDTFSVVGKLDMDIAQMLQTAYNLLEAEKSAEEPMGDVSKIDLTEVGGGDEDDTPLL